MALITLQNRLFWMSKQLFIIHFYIVSCHVCPVVIPAIFAQTQGSDH